MFALHEIPQNRPEWIGFGTLGLILGSALHAPLGFACIERDPTKKGLSVLSLLGFGALGLRLGFALHDAFGFFFAFHDPFWFALVLLS